MARKYPAFGAQCFSYVCWCARPDPCAVSFLPATYTCIGVKRRFDWAKKNPRPVGGVGRSLARSRILKRWREASADIKTRRENLSGVGLSSRGRTFFGSSWLKSSRYEPHVQMRSRWPTQRNPLKLIRLPDREHPTYLRLTPASRFVRGHFFANTDVEHAFIVQFSSAFMRVFRTLCSTYRGPRQSDEY